MTFEEMKSLPEEEQAKLFKKLKAVRTVYKPVNYSAIYGIGAPNLAKDLNEPVKKAKELLDLYWERNWAVKQLCKDLKPSLKVFTNGFMWIRNPVSGFWYSLRFEKDIFSTINQGTGVFCFDTWVAFCRKEGIPVCAQFHDEIVSFTKDRKDTETKIRNACKKLNEKLKLNVELDVDIQFGSCYGDVH